MTDAPESDIIFDWNTLKRHGPVIKQKYELFDETLRDGIQSPSITDPPIERKLEILHLMSSLGIHGADLGLPGAGPRAVADVTALVEEIDRQKLSIIPAAAARTHSGDIMAIVDIAQKTGRAIEVMAFIGSSPIRQLAEDWDVDRLVRLTADAIDLCIKYELPVCYVTEDSIRSRPNTLDRLFRTAVNHGAQRLCLCDTVGHATPDGLRNLIAWTVSLVRGMGVHGKVGIDWHGHNDRGLALTNTISALEAGATRVHGTALGVGERVGNTAMDQLLLNLQLLGEAKHDMTHLLKYCRTVSDAYDVPIPYNYPLAGSDAFRTGTGVHAAAIIKAEAKGDQYLADRIYSGVPAGVFGRFQEIEISPMSGESNVIYWLKKRGIEAERPLVKRIFDHAKATNRTLTEQEVRDLL